MPQKRAGQKGGPCFSPIYIDESKIPSSLKQSTLETVIKFSNGTHNSIEDIDWFWDWLLEQLAAYRGKIQAGTPSTPSERKKRIRKARELALKLEETLGLNDDYCTYATISEMLAIEGGSMSDLKHNLFKLRCLSTNETYNFINEAGKRWTHNINGPAKADPYLFDLMEIIMWRWFELTGHVPAIGGGEEGVPKTGPAFEWLKAIFSLIEKTPPRDDFKEISKEIKAFSKRDGKN